MKVIKVVFSVLGTLVLLTLGGLWYAHEPLPTSSSPEKADLVAEKMLKALNKQAYDSLKVIEWDYLRGHSYVWDKENNSVEVIWDAYEVTLNTKTLDGEASYNSNGLSGNDKKEALSKAWKFFVNDSFWLVAPYKVFDPGTSRKLVELKDPKQYGLLVTYSSGGVTPGDSYLWVLDENYYPIAWKMWVQIIPVGGIEFSWIEWQSFNGALFPNNHMGPFGVELPVRNLKVQ